MSVRVAINGFGRIGRTILRTAIDYDILEFVAINDLTDEKTLAHLLKYDSVHRIMNAEVSPNKGAIVVNGKKIAVTAIKDPSQLPWKDYKIDIVMECTGLFTDKENAIKHLNAGAKKVIISAPAKNPDLTVVMGVNESIYDKDKHHIISNASCTTNCLAPMAKVLDEKFKIKRALMTTVHSYTNDQQILDLPHKDIRRARAASLSMIPTTTGAAVAVSLTLPQLKGKLDGMAIRVPTPNVSLVDLVAELESDVNPDIINNAFKEASESSLKGILQFCDKELVSVDFNGNPHSTIIDGPSTKVIERRMAKVIAWYDNEYGFSCRMRDLAIYISRD